MKQTHTPHRKGENIELLIVFTVAAVLLNNSKRNGKWRMHPYIIRIICARVLRITHPTMAAREQVLVHKVVISLAP